MKKLFKKTLSVFLAVVMTFTITLPAFAEENVQTQTEQDVSYNGTNVLGDVLVSAINETDTSDEDESGINYFILDVEIDGLTATVELCSPDAATLVVAIYDEDTGVMTTSGKTDVDSSTETVTVELAECEMPEYFTVKAFLLNSENAPVCNNYESIKYTEAFQEFLSKTVYDFEYDKVINLDYGYESNFAVVSDDAEVVNASGDENIVVVDDYENGIYVFENANEEITSLSVGDVLYYVYGDEADEYILTKVGNIENDNGTVTITAADDFELSEMFSYIKIDTEQAVYEKPQTFASNDESVDEKSISADFSISLTKEYAIDKNYKVSFSGEFKAKFYLQFYYDFNLFKEDYYEITQSLTVSFTGETEISVSAKKEFEPLVFFHGGIPIYVGIEAEVTFSLKLVFSAKVSVTGAIEVKLVNGSRKIAGYADEDISKKPSVELKVDIAGTVAFDIIPMISVGLEILKVVKVEMVVDGDFCISGTIHTLELSSGDSWLEPDKKHNCDVCVDGTITATVTGHIDVSFGINKKNKKTVLQINLIKLSRDLGDFYISIDKENGIVKDIDFGFSRCPYIEYKVTFKVVDELSNPLEDIQITTNGTTLTTGADGETVCYFNDGTYYCSAVSDDYEIDGNKHTYDEVYYAVHGSPATVKIYMKTVNADSGDSGDDNTGTDNPDVEGTRTITASGTCGDNLTWILYDDGELVIDGTGGMTDYSSSAPWYSYRDSIKSVTIGNGVTTIGEEAFRYCDSLASVTIGNSVTSIGEYAFSECYDIERVYIDSIESWLNISFHYSSNSFYDGWYYGDSYCSNPLCLGADLYANGELLTELTIPDNITHINAFVLAGFETVIIPDSVTSIDTFSFFAYGSLKKITVDENNANYSSDEYGVLFNKDKTELIQYPAGNSRTEYTIPDSVTSIGEWAFYDCTSLTSVTIGNSVTSIGDYAFSGCTSLASVIIPDSVTSIGYRAFYNCTSLTSVTIPDSVTSIGGDAFYWCTSLASVTIGNSVTSIGEWAFYNCTSLTSVTIPDSVTSIGGDAFSGCTSLASVTIPDSVTSIGDYAFHYCTSLTSVTIPDSVTSIGQYTFYNCTSLTSVTIPDSVTSIGYYAFKNCTSLTTVYYTGTEAEWNSISIASNNYSLTNANIICSDTVSTAAVMALSLDDEIEAYSGSNVVSETITSAVLGNSYVILVVKDADAEDLLAAENLLYIDQEIAESETLTFDFDLGDETEYTVIVTNSKLPHPHKYSAVITAPDCTQQGYTTYTCCCGDTYTANYVDALGHKNENNDNYCDSCGYDFTQNCSHNCHSSNAFLRFFWKIALFFNKLFNIESKRICECGVAHW